MSNVQMFSPSEEEEIGYAIGILTASITRILTNNFSFSDDEGLKIKKAIETLDKYDFTFQELYQMISSYFSLDNGGE